MPELPEVETVVNFLKNSFLIGSVILQVEVFKENLLQNTNVTEFQEKLTKQTIHDIKRKGKWIFFHLDTLVLIVHLRMTGNFFFSTNKHKKKKPSIVFHLNDNRDFFYYDPRGFGKIYLQHLNDFQISFPYNEIGEEANVISAKYLFFAINFSKKKTNIKTFLLNQKNISGIGNIYVSEILFAAKIHPLTAVKTLTYQEIERIVFFTKTILNNAIKKQGTSIKDFVLPNEKKGNFQSRLLIYQREKKPCFNCKTLIISLKISGRNTFICQQCQILKN